MKLTKDEMIDPFRCDETTRPWGTFSLFVDNKKCTVKILYIKKGEMLSMQFHFRRDQHYICLSDGFTIDYSNKPVPQSVIDNPDEDWRVTYFGKFLKENMITVKANRGDQFGFKRRVIHRAHYEGSDDYGLILDIALGLNDENDIIRVQDSYNREDIKIK